jgi:hypothetical protein
VQGDQTFVRKIVEQRLRQQVDVKMDDVELIGSAPHLPQHAQRAANVIANACEHQALGRGDDQISPGLRASAREQGNLVSLTNEFLRQP